MKIHFPLSFVSDLLSKVFRRPRGTDAGRGKPALVEFDREAFDRRTLQLFFTDLNGAEAQERLQVMERPLRTGRQLRRVV